MTDPTNWLLIAPILLIVGAIAGTLAGLLGVGGGIVIVPVLYWLTEIGMLDVPEDVAIHFAVATSLLTIIPTSISSARAHHKKGSIDLGMFKSWAPWMVMGALIGGVFAANVNATVLSGVFGIIAIIVVLNMLNPKPITFAAAPPRALPARAAIAGPIGAFSAMMGIGGGTLSVPTMTLLSFSGASSGWDGGPVWFDDRCSGHHRLCIGGTGYSGIASLFHRLHQPSGCGDHFDNDLHLCPTGREDCA